jgi:hypothetical protein
MKILDPGHRYALDQLDTHRPFTESGLTQTLRFVKRIGSKFPGNDPPGYEGTTTQEVLRALIDRTRYVDAQDPHDDNAGVLTALRSALTLLERRAALRRGDHAAAVRIMFTQSHIETLQICQVCGHVMCERKEH